MIWDAIVVGAGPAGCAAAYDLAAAGRRVLLMDKAAFPRPKACAGALTMKAVRALRYSVSPVVRKAICNAVLEHTHGRGRQLQVGRSTPFCVMTVREELDAFCLDKTRRRGAIFRQVGTILDLHEHEECVVLRVAGEPGPLAARYVVGADGVHSRVRELASRAAGPGTPHQPGLPPCWLRKGFAIEANVPYSVTGRTFPLVFDFNPVLSGYGWLFPRNDHVNVGLYTAGDNRQEGKADGGGRTALNVSTLTDYIEARCGTREHERAVGQFLGLGGAGYTPTGTRVLLVGDAAGLVDPLTGEGIHGAIVSGQSAAAAILASLRKGGSAAGRYAKRLARQRADLAVSENAAARFYAHPELGFRLMRLPMVRSAVLHAYSDGASLTTLARGIALASRFAERLRA